MRPGAWIETIVGIALMGVFTAVLIVAFPVGHGNVPEFARFVAAVLVMGLVLKVAPRRIAGWLVGRRQP